MKPLRDLLKHSSVYAVGQILTRLASILLLPLYTHCLSTADYGVTAILDLTAAILSLVIGGGMAAAVTRFHFDEESEEHADRVWWTGVTFVVIAATLMLLPLWSGRQWLSDLMLGSGYVNGAWFFSLTLLNTLLFVIGHIVDTYLRVRKWSGIFVVISLSRLLLNIGLNVWLLVGMKLGVEGLLIGNLTATFLHTSALLIVFVRSRGPFQFSRPMAGKLMHFSAPLIVTAMLSMLMHEADRFVLRTLNGLDALGVYSLGHKIGFAVHTLCLLPFVSIWHVAIYDIEKLPDAKETFSKIFGWFVAGLGILYLGASLIVHPVLPWLTPDAYGDAIDLIAVILLGCFVFALHFHFEVPVLLAKRTSLTVPGAIAGAVTNVAANFALIPLIGAWGAAWAGVITYAVFSFTGLFMYRKVDRQPFPWMNSMGMTLLFCGTYVGVRYGIFPHVGAIAEIALSVGVCALLALLLFRPAAVELLAAWQSRRAAKSMAADAPNDETASFEQLEEEALATVG